MNNQSVLQRLKFSALHPELTFNVARHNTLTFFATVCGTVFIVQNLYVFVPLAVLVTWAALLILCSLVRLLSGIRMKQFLKAGSQWRSSTIQYIIITGLVGLLTGCSAVLAKYYAGVEEQLFIFALLVGFSGGAVATLSPVFMGYLVYVTGILFPQMLVVFIGSEQPGFYHSEALEGLIGYLGVLYLIVITGAAKILHGTFIESILLRNELETARDQAESANRAKSKFLSSISHELRTPLHVILGSNQMLEIDKQLSPSQQEFVNLIQQGGDMLLKLIDQVLDFAKIEAGKVKLELTEFQLNLVLEQCQSLMASVAEKAEIELIFKFPDKELTLINDPMRLKQIVLNLVSNAIKYNRPKGQVVVETIPLSAGKIKILVKDTGYGIPAARRDELFVSFNRLGRETGEQEGTGIGLVICKDLITVMGGSIDFESVETQGSSFWIVLDSRFFSYEDMQS